MSTVGTAYVVVRAISPSVEKDIQSSVSKAVEKATPAITKASAKAGRASSKAIGDEMGKAAPKVGAEFGDGVSRGFTRSIVAGISSAVRRISSSIPTKGAEGAGTKIALGVVKGIDKFKIPAKFWIGFLGIPALGGAIQILTAYVAGAVSLVGAIGPAFAAAGGVATASLVTLGGAIGGLMAAFKTESKYLTSFKEDIKEIGKEFRPIGLAVQKAAFPALEAAFENLTRIVPTLKTGLAGLGATIGDVAVNLSKTITSSQNLASLKVVFAEGKPQLASYGAALGSLATIFLTIAKVSAPLTTRFAAFVEQFAKGAEAATSAGAASGRLSAFMERAGVVAAQLGQIFGDTFRGLFNVLSASAPAGQVLLDRISALAAKFAEWSGSLKGQSELRAFFNNALPVIREVNGLIADVLALIVKPLAGGDTGGVITFIRALRTDVLPALQEVGAAASTLGPALVELTTTFTGLIKVMADSGALGAFVGTLSFLLGALTSLFQLPVVGQLAAWGVAFLGVAKALGIFLAPFGGLAKVFGPILRFIGPLLGTALKALGGGLMTLGRVILPVVIAGIKALSAALFANPIGLVVLAVIALVAILVVAYKKSDKFREIVDKVGAAIRDGFIGALNWLKDTWAKVWPALQEGWEAVKSAFTTGINAIKGAVSAVGAFISSAWDKIKAAFAIGLEIVKMVLGVFADIFNVITQPFQGLIQYFTGMWQVISGIFTGNTDKITTGIANMVGGIVRFFFGMPARILGAIAGLATMVAPYFMSMMSQIGTWVVNGITAVVGFFTALPGQIMTAVASLLGSFNAWVAGIVTSVREGFVNGFNAIVTFLAAFPGRALAAVNGLIARLRAWAISAWNNVRTAFTNGVNNVVTFVRAMPGRVLSAVNSLISQLRSWATTTWSNVRSAFTTGVNNVVTLVRGLPARIVSAVGNLSTRLSQAGRDLIAGFASGITDRLNGLLKTARELADKVKNAVKGALGINSPSKVFALIGRQLGDGLVVGIKGSEKAVAKAGTNLASSAVPGVPRTAGGPGTSSFSSSGVISTAAGTIHVDTIEFSIDDVDKMSKVTDFIEMIQGARVVTRMTERSGTVTA